MVSPETSCIDEEDSLFSSDIIEQSTGLGAKMIGRQSLNELRCQALATCISVEPLP